jgi:hypothetical protein
MTEHNVVSGEEWAAAGEELLVRENRHDEYGAPDGAEGVATDVGAGL